MLTIEKFYFDYNEASPYVSASADSTDLSIEFVGSDDAPISIKITMRGRENFRKLVQQIYDVGIGCLAVRGEK